MIFMTESLLTLPASLDYGVLFARGEFTLGATICAHVSNLVQTGLWVKPLRAEMAQTGLALASSAWKKSRQVTGNIAKLNSSSGSSVD
jgi:hypothetical protein